MWENKTYIVQCGTLLNNVISELNKLGKDNWEVCSCFKNNSNEVIFFLKRKIDVKRKKK